MKATTQNTEQHLSDNLTNQWANKTHVQNNKLSIFYIVNEIMSSVKSIKMPIGLIFCILIYAGGVLAFASWENNEFKKQLYLNIDGKLLLTAKSLKFILAEDFHDRALDESSITFEEELKNRGKFNKLISETDLTWLYTIVEKDGKFYFTAPTVTSEEAQEKKRWYYLAYEDIPDAFLSAFKERRTVFVEYTDKWGTYRSVALPQVSPGGRLYLACADYEITYLKALMSQNYWKSSLTALFFLMIASPFLFLFRNYISRLKNKKQKLEENHDLLEKRVMERTAELRISKENAEQLVEELGAALDNINTLRGLIPICSNCKQIRDDKGYWHQLEAYIKEHSEAIFSHGICPDCVEKLYPNIDLKKLRTACEVGPEKSTSNITM